MKTAISLDEELLNEADKTAKELGVSRSRLFSMAMKDYLRHRRNEAITETLNRVYAKGQTAEDKRIVAGIKARMRSIIRERY